MKYLNDDNDDEEDWEWGAGDHPLAEDYMIFVDAPESEEDMALIYAISSITFKNGVYHPLFIINEKGLGEHQLWTLQYSSNKDVFGTTEVTDMYLYYRGLDFSRWII